MKKLLQGAALMGAVLFCFCGAASAAESNGIYNLSVETAYSGSVTVTPQTAAGAGITSSSTTINGAEVAGFYAGAVKLQVAYTVKR